MADSYNRMLFIRNRNKVTIRATWVHLGNMTLRERSQTQTPHTMDSSGTGRSTETKEMSGCQGPEGPAQGRPLTRVWFPWGR